jgi:hypothetical protein
MGTLKSGELFATSSSADQLTSGSRTLMRETQKNPELIDSLAKAAASVKGESRLTEETFMSILRADDTLAKAATDQGVQAELKNFLADLIEEGKVTAEPSKNLTINGGETEQDDTTFDELRLKLLALIADIPIAHPGEIITSEHHNSLRRAIKALALLIQETETTSIHTIAPILLPMEDEKDGENEGGSHEWKLFVDKAVVPSIREQGGAGGTVKGGLLVRLPDNVLIKAIIVRGRRVSENDQDPKAFDVTFLRIDPNKGKPKPVELLNFDLKDETGFFARKAAPKSAVKVDNVKNHYYVTAVWEDDDDSSAFEIRSFQFICER